MCVCLFVFMLMRVCVSTYVNKNDYACSGVLAFIVKLQAGYIKNNIFFLTTFVFRVLFGSFVESTKRKNFIVKLTEREIV